MVALQYCRTGCGGFYCPLCVQSSILSLTWCLQQNVQAMMVDDYWNMQKRGSNHNIPSCVQFLWIISEIKCFYLFQVNVMNEYFFHISLFVLYSIYYILISWDSCKRYCFICNLFVFQPFREQILFREHDEQPQELRRESQRVSKTAQGLKRPGLKCGQHSVSG